MAKRRDNRGQVERAAGAAHAARYRAARRHSRRFEGQGCEGGCVRAHAGRALLAPSVGWEGRHEKWQLRQQERRGAVDREREGDRKPEFKNNAEG